MNDHAGFFWIRTGKLRQICIVLRLLESHLCEVAIAYLMKRMGGLIGLEIAKAFHLNPKPNSNWSPQTEALFLSGI